MHKKANPRGTNQKYTALMLIPIILLSMAGFAYAQWNDIIVVSATMSFGTENMGFVQPLECKEYQDPTTGQLIQGEYLGKDVGNCECEYQESKTDIETGKTAYKKLTILLNNGYPDYIVHCNFTLENIGTLPVHITGLVISDSTGVLKWDPTLNALVDAEGKPIFSIVITPALVCQKLWPWDDPTTPEIEPVQLQAEIHIHIAQNAKECNTYSFQVTITYEVVT